MRRVLDGRDSLDAFKKEHGIKSDGLARALMFIATFEPPGRPCDECGAPWTFYGGCTNPNCLNAKKETK